MADRVLVLPAGTEIGHEIHDSLEFSRFWEIHGANEVNDHSSLIYRNIHLGLPNVYHDEFVDAAIALAARIDARFVIPAHDEAVFRLAGTVPAEMLVGPEPNLAAVLRSKTRTIAALDDVIAGPTEISRNAATFPMFLKPDRGQGSRGAMIIRDAEELEAALARESDCVLQELLPGEEITIDCFSDRENILLYAHGRVRLRTSGGIATRTASMPDDFLRAEAEAISSRLKISGAWFFQVKMDRQGRPKLLEVANRIAGSSGFQRMRGVNLMEAWLHQKAGRTVAMPEGPFLEIISDRALYSKVHVALRPETIYVDFDDTIILSNSEINYRLVGLLFGLKYRCGCSIQLITRHDGIVEQKLKTLALTDLFDHVHHLQRNELKSSVIAGPAALFIDDSFSERKEVSRQLGIASFPLECLETLEGIIEGWHR
ncbi:acetyl-CoA carboxylase biotin carboxylase subunit family protein [Sphingomonas sp. MMS24-J13]|uniref:ATP-grasp domain-containing protein n=1 Tax=Sphingomonas sp. MMS24-J13 TaxID=3238686 RepID=UPI00384EA02F